MENSMAVRCAWRPWRNKSLSAQEGIRHSWRVRLML